VRYNLGLRVSEQTLNSSRVPTPCVLRKFQNFAFEDLIVNREDAKNFVEAEDARGQVDNSHLSPNIREKRINWTCRRRTQNEKYSRTPLIWTLIIRITNYPDRLGPSGKHFLAVTVLRLCMA
jgi:hypothetical protein